MVYTGSGFTWRAQAPMRSIFSCSRIGERASPKPSLGSSGSNHYYYIYIFIIIISMEIKLILSFLNFEFS